jgi:transposase
MNSHVILSRKWYYFFGINIRGIFGDNMKKVELSMKGLWEYHVIKRLVDEGGNKERARVKLRCSINRFIKGYEQEGEAYFIHGNCGRKPSHTLSEDMRTEIIEIYRKYREIEEINLKFFVEQLSAVEKIKVSYGAVKQILASAGIYSSRMWRSTKRRLREEVRNGSAPDEAVETVQPNIEVSPNNAHPRRPRRLSNFKSFVKNQAHRTA